MSGVWTGSSVSDSQGIASRLDARLRARCLPLMVVRRLIGRSPIAPHRDDTDVLRLYQGIAAQSGVEFVIDSSKLASYALLLAGLPGMRVQVVHLVRDPRAGAFSWTRVKESRDVNAGINMSKMSVLRSSLDWVLWNTVIRLFWSSECRLEVRYEDFVTNPLATIERIADEIGVSVPEGLVELNAISLNPTHTVAGNPSRLDSGLVVLREDKEWQRVMPRSAVMAVSAITYLLRRRFNYHDGWHGARSQS